MIMACARLKSYVTDLNNNMLSALCKVIRYPDSRFSREDEDDID